MKGLPTPTAQQPPLCHPPHNRQRPALPLAGRPRPASASSQLAWIYKGPFSWRLRHLSAMAILRFPFNELRLLQRNRRSSIARDKQAHHLDDSSGKQQRLPQP